MPGLVEASQRHPELTFIAVTEAERGEAAMFRTDYGIPFPVLAEAEASREAWGVDFIWGDSVYFVGKDGRVVSQGFYDLEAVLMLHAANIHF
jgi:hypothetical protein